MNTEDLYIGNLERRVENLYDYFRTHISYSNKGFYGELDLLGYIKKYCDIYEVKSTDSKNCVEKARNQLFRAKSYFPQNVNSLFLYIGKTDTLYRLFLTSGDFELISKP